jgi:hypothetical protein
MVLTVVVLLGCCWAPSLSCLSAIAGCGYGCGCGHVCSHHGCHGGLEKELGIENFFKKKS